MGGVPVEKYYETNDQPSTFEYNGQYHTVMLCVIMSSDVKLMRFMVITDTGLLMTLERTFDLFPGSVKYWVTSSHMLSPVSVGVNPSGIPDYYLYSNNRHYFAIQAVLNLPSTFQMLRIVTLAKREEYLFCMPACYPWRWYWLPTANDIYAILSAC